MRRRYWRAATAVFCCSCSRWVRAECARYWRFDMTVQCCRTHCECLGDTHTHDNNCNMLLRWICESIKTVLNCIEIQTNYFSDYYPRGKSSPASLITDIWWHPERVRKWSICDQKENVAATSRDGATTEKLTEWWPIAANHEPCRHCCLLNNLISLNNHPNYPA